MKPLEDGLSQPHWHDVRFIGAIAGRYALSGRKRQGAGADVFACRLCSISTRMAVVVAPVIGKVGESVAAHFEEFGILHGKIKRQLTSGFAMDIAVDEAERDKLAAKIAWQKKYALNQLPDRREHKRTIPRDPRTVLTMGGGEQVSCFIIDLSQTGVAISADIQPELGTPLAVGRVVGRVVRYLDVGFAVHFLERQDTEVVETRLGPPDS
jgi:hypothetical protein